MTQSETSQQPDSSSFVCDCKVGNCEGVFGVSGAEGCRRQPIKHRGAAAYETMAGMSLTTEGPVYHQLVVEPGPPTAGDILEKMAQTFRERNAVYGSNYKMVAPLMAALFPNGVPPHLVVQDHFHLFELILVKLSRFAISDLTHQDSIHDAGVYCAMIEMVLADNAHQLAQSAKMSRG